MDKQPNHDSCMNQLTGKPKIGYKLLAQAEADLLQKRKQYPNQSHHIYPCSICGDYHLSTTKQNSTNQKIVEQKGKIESEAQYWMKRIKIKKK